MMQKLPSMRALQVFEAFGRLQSATAAASELSVTIGAISQQLRKIESELGLRLIERRGNAIQLSPIGLRYHADIAVPFDLLRDAKKESRTTRALQL